MVKITGSKRCKFVIEFECDLDRVQGWGDNPNDWIVLACNNFVQQSHYNTKATTKSITINNIKIK